VYRDQSALAVAVLANNLREMDEAVEVIHNAIFRDEGNYIYPLIMNSSFAGHFSVLHIR
jgi:hypothetical protein